MLLLGGCIDEFRPKVDGYDQLLVVDGGITNLPGPYTVRLGRSISVYGYEYQYTPVEGALVVILAESGGDEALTEVEPGVYRTSPDGIRGQPGERYKLVIRTFDNVNYETDWEELRAPTPVATVDYALEYKYFPDVEREVPGYQFYLTSGSPEQAQNYYVYFLEETYKYRAQFPLRFIWDQGRLNPVKDRDSLRTCWRTATVHEIFAANTGGYSDPKINGLPLHFQRADQIDLRIRYSLLARQYSVGPEAYAFWRAIADQVGNLESLYNRQPYQVRGNVYNPLEPEEPILGYFLVAGVAEQRIFADAPQGLDIDWLECFPNYEGYADLFRCGSECWPDYVTQVGEARAIAGLGCINCEQLGGRIQRPEFWTD